MIDCNLAVLLAERDLKITKVSKDTGISRTTLTALCNDYSGGVKFDTINTLCTYLKVTPEDFFSYLPYEYDFVDLYIDIDVIFCEMTVTKYSTKRELPIYGNFDIGDHIPCEYIDCTFELMYPPDYDEAYGYEQAIKEFKRMYSKMTPRQKIQFKQSLTEKVKELIEVYIAEKHDIPEEQAVLSKDFDANIMFSFIE